MCRVQLPVMLYCALTAHEPQGANSIPGIKDLCKREAYTMPIFAYLSHPKRTDGLLIDPMPFNIVDRLLIGASTMLNINSQEEIDWRLPPHAAPPQTTCRS